MIYTLGIDIGSTTSKCVLLENGTAIAAKSLVVAGTGTDGPRQAFEAVLEQGGISREQVAYVMATGYGRATFSSMDSEMSELSCHAKGMYAVAPGVRTIIDIGGQDAKVIRLNDQGRILNFLMNDKCAAGTGRFLDVMAGILQMDVDELGGYALQSKEPARISSTCTVFAESEVISQLSKGVHIPDLVAGICNSVASRVAALAKRADVKNDVYMTGGVAKNQGVREALARELGVPVLTTEDAQYMGAMGAAVAAFEKCQKG